MILGISEAFANFKYIFYTAFVAFIIGLYYFFHYQPIHELQDDVKQLKLEVFNKDTTINNLNIEVIRCKESKKVKEFESYFEGLANEENDANNTIVFPTYSF